jgi:hypothetical protein
MTPSAPPGPPLIRPLRPPDVRGYVDVPPVRLWGYAAEREGRVVAFGGLAFTPDAVVAFMQGHDQIPAFPLAFHRAVTRGLREAKARGIPRIVALADAGVPAAERWLARLGFKRCGNAWVWEA